MKINSKPIIKSPLKLLVVLIFALGTNFTLALNTYADGLSLSPNLCLLAKNESVCSLKMTAKWQTPTNGDFCLTHDNSEQIIQCWVSKSNGEVNFDLSLIHSTKIALVEQNSEKIIFQKEIKLHHELATIHKKKRKPWQFY